MLFGFSMLYNVILHILHQLTINLKCNVSADPLRRKAATHDSEIRYLYEEMEAQIKNEKDRLVLKVQELERTHNLLSCAHLETTT